MKLISFYEHKEKPVQYMCDRSLSGYPHLHKELEIIYSASGIGDAVINKVRYHLTPGDLLLVAPNQIHFYNTVKPGDFYVMIFSPDIVTDMKRILLSNVPDCNKISLSPDSLTVSAILGMAENYRDGSDFCYTLAVGYANIIMYDLIGRFSFHELPTSGMTLISNLLQYCTMHYNEELSLDLLSETLLVSKYHISHVFNQTMGMNFNDYINYIRVFSACDLLKTTDMSITEISSAVGFGTSRSFNNAFMKLHGTTPSGYRNTNKIIRRKNGAADERKEL